MCLTFRANEFAKERRQLGRHMATGDGVGELNAGRFLGRAAAIEHGEGQVGALLYDTWNALKSSRRLEQLVAMAVQLTYPGTDEGYKHFDACAVHMQQFGHVEIQWEFSAIAWLHVHQAERLLATAHSTWRLYNQL